MSIALGRVVEDIADSLVAIDSSGVPFRGFMPGVGPYGEPQLVKLVAGRLNQLPDYSGKVRTKRTPDLLITSEWAMEFKIARPFGDNGKPAENWSVNLLHPYPGNTSLLGDCLKLATIGGDEKRAVLVVAYEHTPPVIVLDPLIDAFEIIATNVLHIHLGERTEAFRGGLVHPIHSQLRLCAWELLK